MGAEQAARDQLIASCQLLGADGDNRFYRYGPRIYIAHIDGYFSAQTLRTLEDVLLGCEGSNHNFGLIETIGKNFAGFDRETLDLSKHRIKMDSVAVVTDRPMLRMIVNVVRRMPSSMKVRAFREIEPAVEWIDAGLRHLSH